MISPYLLLSHGEPLVLRFVIGTSHFKGCDGISKVAMEQLKKYNFPRTRRLFIPVVAKSHSNHMTKAEIEAIYSLKQLKS